MLDFFQEVVGSELWRAVLLAGLTALVGRWITGRPRLFWNLSHQYAYLIPRIGEDGNFAVYTRQIWVRNEGRSPVRDLENVLNYIPQHYEIWPPRKFTPSTLPDGRHVIEVPILAGKDAFTVSMIETRVEVPNVAAIRSEAGPGYFHDLVPQWVHPRWMQALGVIVVLIGMATIAFALLNGIELLIAALRESGP